MNKVADHIYLSDYTSADQLTGENLKQERTAFVGMCGDGPPKSLYLVTYSGIFLADNPTLFWDDPSCPVTVRNFVDVEIKIL